MKCYRVEPKRKLPSKDHRENSFNKETKALLKQNFRIHTKKIGIESFFFLIKYTKKKIITNYFINK